MPLISDYERDERTLEYLKKDFSILLRGIEGKSLSEIDLDAVIGLLELLQTVVKRVQAGISARDTFISYTLNPDNVSSIFAKKNGKNL